MQALVEIPPPEITSDNCGDSKDKYDAEILNEVRLDVVQRADYIRPDEKAQDESGSYIQVGLN